MSLFDRVSGLFGKRRYEPPRLEIYHREDGVAWAFEQEGEQAPDDTLKAVGATGAPEVLGWVRPDGDETATIEPKLYIAPKDPKRKTSGDKKRPKKTTRKKKKTVAKARRTKIVGKDAFGGRVCTCDLVCTCNLVCTCQAVCTCVSVCSCVSYSPPRRKPRTGGTSRRYCSCVPVCTCVPVAH